MKSNIQRLVGRSKLYLVRSAPTILSCIAAGGVVATAVMAVKATPKATRLIKAAEFEGKEELTKLEIVRITAPVYIPAVIVGLSTISCIFGAHILNRKQQAALFGAYTLANNAYKEYRQKVVDKYGEDGDKSIIEAIARGKYKENKLKPSENKRLFWEENYGQYFEASMEDVIEAEYFVNRQLSTEGFVTLNKFYQFIGLEPIESGNVLGWSIDKLLEDWAASWVDFGHETIAIDDDLEATIIRIYPAPSADYMDLWYE